MAQNSRIWDLAVNLTRGRGLTTNVAVGRNRQYQLIIFYRSNWWGEDQNKAYVQLIGVNDSLEAISFLQISDDTGLNNGTYLMNDWLDDENTNETLEIPLHYGSILHLVWTDRFKDRFYISSRRTSGGISDQPRMSVADLFKPIKF